MSETVTVTALSTQGEGIARREGKAVFVPFALPGETWDVDTVERRKNYDRAVPTKRREETPAHPARVKAPCPYYGACGGCQLQHVGYEEQLELKRQWLEETFRRLAHLDVSAQPVIASPEWEYRNKVTIPVIERNGAIVLAFHEMARPRNFVTVQDCPISHARIRAAMPVVTENLQAARPRLRPHAKDETQGSRVVFRVLDGRLSLQFHELEFAEDALARLIRNLLEEAGAVEDLYVFRSPERYEHFSRREEAVTAQPDSFVQVNDAVRARLYEHVLGLPYRSAVNVLDGYCGVGHLTRRLAGRFERVVGVELNASAVSDARQAVDADGLQDRVLIVAQPLEAFLRNDRDRFDAMILNPPRAGLSTWVREEAAKKKPADLVIVSCHPAALARDTAEFVNAGYEIVNLQPFDMFPQTYHYEVAAFLQRPV